MSHSRSNKTPAALTKSRLTRHQQRLLRQGAQASNQQLGDDNILGHNYYAALLDNSPSSPQREFTNTISIQTKKSRQTRITTPDGTQIETNGSTKITISHSPTTAPIAALSPHSPLVLSDDSYSPPTYNQSQIPGENNQASPSFTVLDITEDARVSDDDESEEKENALAATPAPASAGMFGWLKAGIAAMTLKNSLTFALKSGVSLVAASGSALNAMMGPSGKQPKDIGASWWNDMSIGTRIYSIWKLFASLSVNVVFAYKSIPNAAEKLRHTLFKKNQTRKEKALNALFLTMAIAAAVALSAITFNSFAWTASFVAGTMAIASFSINTTTRFNGIKDAINVFRAIRDPEMKVVDEAIDLLGRIRPKDKPMFNGFLQQALAANGNVYSDQTITAFAMKFALEIEHNNAALIEEKEIHHVAAERLGIAFRIACAAAVCGPSFLTFMQKGYDGFNQLSNNSMSDLPPLAEAAIGVESAISNALLYSISAYMVPKQTVDISKRLYHQITTDPSNPRTWIDTLLFGYLVGANIDASTSMATVAKGILANAKRICSFITAGTTLGEVYVWANQIGGGLTNFSGNLGILLGSNTENATIDDLVRELTYRRSYDKRLSTEAVSAFKRVSFFVKSHHYEAKPKLEKNTAASHSTSDLMSLEAAYTKQAAVVAAKEAGIFGSRRNSEPSLSKMEEGRSQPTLPAIPETGKNRRTRRA